MLRFIVFVIIGMIYVFPVSAQEQQVQTLAELIDETTQRSLADDFLDDFEQPVEIRLDAIKQAALSYGARAGLAKRTQEIRDSIEQQSAALDRIYDFKRLLIPSASGLLIEPPIISQGENATLIESGGQTAAVADKIFNINRNARIVSTPRNWRAYLEREWGDLALPPQILLPRTNEEKRIWIEHLTIGWNEGLEQADEIFQADLDKLVADYTGMIRYRKLLSQGIVSAPYALQVDRGVTGGGDEMRVGDRAVQITGPSQLMTEAFEWQPVSR